MTTQYVVTDEELTAVANAIRTKGGTSADLEWYSDFVSAIGAITGGGGSGGSAGGGLSISDFLELVEGYPEDYFLVPYYTSNTNPTGYTLSYSAQQNTSVPAWALFNSSISGTNNASVSNYRWTSNQPVPQWVQIKLPEAKKINAFYISTIVSASNNLCKTYLFSLHLSPLLLEGPGEAVGWLWP